MDKFHRSGLCLVVLGAIAPSIASAQIVPDTTLPNNSIVNLEGQLQRITGGTAVGTNLFHSLDLFNLGTGERAYFDNSLNIENIITRVTGGQVSNIDGLIRANGEANLFLINPHGIAFGENARLEIGGSFFGTTAESLLFESGGIYSALEPNPPSLLTISVPIGLQMGANPGTISLAGTGISETFIPETTEFSVNPGNTLALVGGNISLDGGILTAPSGRIEIGSLANGEVRLTRVPVGWQLAYPGAEIQSGMIRLENRSSVWNPQIGEIAIPGSGIQVRAGTVVLARSQIAAATLGNVPSGEVSINARHLELLDGGRIQTLNLGDGDAGNITVNADSILIRGFAPLNPAENSLTQRPNSRISSEILAGGKGGNVSIAARELTLLDGGLVATGTATTGEGGQISVNAADITITGAVPFDPVLPSGLNSQSLGAGNGGDIQVSTERLRVNEGGLILSLARGSGLGGDIAIRASESIDARDLNPFLPVMGGILALTTGQADSGQIDVSTARLSVSGGAKVSSAVFPQLPGVPVTGEELGKANSVTVNAEFVEVTGSSPLAPENFSQITSVTLGAGSTEDVTISTGRLSLRDGGTIASGAALSFTTLGDPVPNAGRGDGGNVTVYASESIEVLGVTPISFSPSLLTTATLGEGDAGDIEVITPRLRVSEGGFVGSTTAVGGDAGMTTIDASEVLVMGTSANGLPSTVGANATILDAATREAFFLPDFPTGNTGRLTLNADRLTVRDGGLVGVQHEGTGNAGNLQINAHSVSLDRGGRIAATTATGLGGNIDLHVKDSLQLRRGSSLTAAALGGTGNSGNLDLDAETIAVLDNSAISANSVGGNGGNIEIETTGLFVSSHSQITASSQLGIDGTIEIKTPEIDTNAGLVEFSQGAIDVDRLIAQNPCGNPGKRSFIVTGRRGLPDDPRNVLNSQTVWEDWRIWSPESGDERSSTVPISVKASIAPHRPLVEAQGWIQHPNGTIELVTHSPASPSNFDRQTPNCGELSLPN